jgi:hypothetical protein
MRAQLADTRAGQAPLDQSPIAVAAAASLRREQIVRLAALAIVLWYAAALCIRLGLPTGLYGGSAGALLFVATAAGLAHGVARHLGRRAAPPRSCLAWPQRARSRCSAMASP